MGENNRDSTAKFYIFLKGNSTKKNYDDIYVTLRDKGPFYYTVKNWVAMFRTGHEHRERRTLGETI
jgi:hypothetical protein